VRRIRIRLGFERRLLVSYVGLVALLGGACMTLGFLVHQERAAILSIQERYNHYGAIQELQQAVTAYRHAGSEVTAAMLARDQTRVAESERAMRAARDEVEPHLKQLAAFDPKSEHAIRVALDEIPADARDAVPYILSGKQPELSIALAKLKTQTDLVESTLERIGAQEKTEAAALGQRAREQADSSIMRASAIIFTALLLSVALSQYFSRLISRPLRATTRALRELNSGQTTLDLPPVTPDEFGDLAQALRQLRDGGEELRRLAYYDPLTGLGNRVLLEEQLQGALSGARRAGGRVGVVGIDVDHFRRLTQRLGNRIGDSVLCEVVTRLRSVLQPHIQLYRYSGDKFIVVVQASEPDGVSAYGLKVFADCVLRAVSEPVIIANHALDLSVSIGMAIFPDDGNNPEALLSSADVAVYAAKRAGGNAARFGTASPAEAMRKQLSMAGELRRSLQNGDFDVLYQPVVDVRSHCVVGAEAVLRWRHPQRGVLMPSDFVKAAEESGQIVELGEHCIQLAHRQAAEWADQGLQLRIAVNLFPRQLNDGNVLRVIERVQKRERRDHFAIDFDLAEGFEGSEDIRCLLELIKERGYRIGLDDFGSSYLSFSYLRQLPIDKLKVGRIITGAVDASREAAALVAATLTLSLDLGLEVVCAGVESAGQVQLLEQSFGCSLQQGSAFSDALPAERFARWMAAYEARERGDLPANMRGDHKRD
jgi:diguanylate cyclase (GGDEF)-like protein